MTQFSKRWVACENSRPSSPSDRVAFRSDRERMVGRLFSQAKRWALLSQIWESYPNQARKRQKFRKIWISGFLKLPNTRGYSKKKWVGVCGPLPKTLTLFMSSLQAKICDFAYPIYELLMTYYKPKISYPIYMMMQRTACFTV